MCVCTCVCARCARVCFDDGVWLWGWWWWVMMVVVGNERGIYSCLVTRMTTIFALRSPFSAAMKRDMFIGWPARRYRQTTMAHAWETCRNHHTNLHALLDITDVKDVPNYQRQNHHSTIPLGTIDLALFDLAYYQWQAAVKAPSRKQWDDWLPQFDWL